MQTVRDRRDRCPGAYRPWQADDGFLVRLRLIGGHITSDSLRRLVDVAETFGDGRVHVTNRANLQVRGFPGRDGRLDPAARAALHATGLVPTHTHELVRNVMVSPQSGLAGGRADLRGIAADLDRRLCADPGLADLPARFLFVFDDGRGDLVDRTCDLGLVAIDGQVGQLRIGAGWGEVIPLSSAAARLVALAAAFARARGTGPTAPWHVAELPVPLTPPLERDARLPGAADRLPFGDVRGGRHVRVPELGLDQAGVAALTAVAELIVTPWRGVLIPDQGGRHD